MSEHMPDVEGAVTKKIGPLPGWAWVAIIAGGAWGYTLWKRHSAGTSAPSAASLSTAASPDFPAGTGNAGGGIGFSGSTNPATAGPLGSPSVTSNAQWVSSTTDQMVANGANVSDVSNALTTYINGGTLTPSQQSLVNQAVTHYGSPPQGVLPVKTATTPPLAQRYVRYVKHDGDNAIYGITSEGQEVALSNPEYLALGSPHFDRAMVHDIGSANPNSAHIYISKDGDTLTSIAQRFYGSSDPVKLAGLRAHNFMTPERPAIGTPIQIW